MSQDVKRRIPDNTPIYLVGESSSEPSTTCIVLARDHDRIVAELKAEVERLKNERKVQEFRIQSHEPVMEQLDLDLQRTLRRNVKLSETIARQAKVIEKLKTMVSHYETCATVDRYDDEDVPCDCGLEKELDAIEKEET